MLLCYFFEGGYVIVRINKCMSKQIGATLVSTFVHIGKHAKPWGYCDTDEADHPLPR